jgi:hypothetical protein
MLGRLGLVVTIVFTIWAPAAVACNDPSLGAVTPSAREGDSVSFSAVHLDPGASYIVLIEGRDMAQGVAGDSGTISGTFTMPDLGRAGTYSVELHVAHDDGTWISSRPVSFNVPEPVPVPAPASKPAAATVPKPATPAASTRAHVAPESAPATKHPSAPMDSVLPATTHSRTHAAAVDRAARQGVARLADKKGAAVAKPRSRTATWAGPARADVPAPVIRASRQLVPVATLAGRRRGHDLHLVLIAILGIVPILGVGSAGMLAWRIRLLRRNASLAVDAELQEMIAEARASRDADLRFRERV